MTACEKVRQLKDALSEVERAFATLEASGEARALRSAYKRACALYHAAADALAREEGADMAAVNAACAVNFPLFAVLDGDVDATAAELAIAGGAAFMRAQAVAAALAAHPADLAATVDDVLVNE